MRYSKGMRKTFIILGIIIAIMPYTGFPSGFKTMFFFFSGLLIAVMGYMIHTAGSRMAETPHKEKSEKPIAVLPQENTDDASYEGHEGEKNKSQQEV